MSKIITTKIAVKAMTMITIIVCLYMLKSVLVSMVNNNYDLDASVKSSIVEFKVSGKKSDK